MGQPASESPGEKKPSMSREKGRESCGTYLRGTPTPACCRDKALEDGDFKKKSSQESSRAKKIGLKRGAGHPKKTRICPEGGEKWQADW